MAIVTGVIFIGLVAVITPIISGPQSAVSAVQPKIATQCAAGTATGVSTSTSDGTMKPVAHVILLLGQSNMSGRARDFTPTIDHGDPRILQYSYDGVLKPAIDPLGHPDKAQLGGPGMAFAREYLTMLPATDEILLIPAAFGGTSFSTPDSNKNNLSWDPSRPADPNNLYERSLTQVKGALTKISISTKIEGALLNIGGTDALNHLAPASFQEKLDTMISAYRSRLTRPDLPFVLGPSRPDVIAANSWYQAINDVQIATPARVSHTAYIPGAIGSDFYNVNDSVHFNMVGDRAMGLQYAHALQELLGGMPTLMAPTGLESSPAAQSAALEVKWNPVPGATGYKVEYKPSAAGNWIRFGTTAALTARPIRLTPSTQYDFRITATDGCNDLGPGSTILTAETSAAQVSTR